MLSGIWPRGNSKAPGSGNTGITSGRLPGPRYSALIGMCGPDAAGSKKIAGVEPELDHDANKWNRIMISSLCLSMICAQTRFRVCRVENRFPPPDHVRGHAFPDHAL